MLTPVQDVVCVMLTRNRAAFAARSARALLGHSKVRLFVVDGSAPQHWSNLIAETDVLREEHAHLEVHHFGERASASSRLMWALEESTEPLVWLMADDDLTLPDWHQLRSEVLGDPACVAAYGKTLRFGVGHRSFEPYGTLTAIYPQVPIPDPPWLEDDVLDDRLRSLGTRPLTSLGWYALHRREALTEVLKCSLATRNPDNNLEYCMNIMQPVLGKVRASSAVVLARQDNPVAKHLASRCSRRQYWSSRREVLELIATHLATHSGAPVDEASEMLRIALQPDASYCAQFSLTRLARIFGTRAQDFTARLSRWLHLHRYRSRGSLELTKRDPRLPEITPGDVRRSRRFVENAVLQCGARGSLDG